MTEHRIEGETVVLANYSTRGAAEVAKSHLDERGIPSFVVADSAHTTLDYTQGVRLVVERDKAAAARDVLEDAEALPEGRKQEADEERAEFSLRENIGVPIAVVGIAVVVVGAQVGSMMAVIIGMVILAAGGFLQWQNTGEKN